MVREGAVECLAETSLQFPCRLLCGVRFASVFHVFREVLYKCVVCGGHPVVNFLKTLLGCRRCCFGGCECVVVKECERLPSVVYGLLLGIGPSVHGIPKVDGGLSAFMLKWSCLRVLV